MNFNDMLLVFLLTNISLICTGGDIKKNAF